MTSINITNTTPLTLTSLIITGSIGGNQLDWDTPVQPTFWETEVWVSDDNDRSNATLLTTTIGTSYYHQVTSGLTRYYWIRTKDSFGNTNGVWEPLSSTGGVTATPEKILPVDLGFNAQDTLINAGAWRQSYAKSGGSGSTNNSRSNHITNTSTSSSSVSSGTSAQSREPGTTWDTWHTIGGTGAISISSITQVKYNLSLMLDWDALSCTIGTVDVYVRARLRNVTDSTDIDGSLDDTFEFHPLSWKATDTVVRSQSTINWHTMSSTDIPANKQVELIIDIKKVKSDASSTLDLFWERCTADLTLL